MRQERDNVNLRMPRALKEFIEAQAKLHMRSRNAEILALVKAAQIREERQNAAA